MQRGGLAPGSVKVPEPAKGPGLPRTPTAGAQAPHSQRPGLTRSWEKMLFLGVMFYFLFGKYVKFLKIYVFNRNFRVFYIPAIVFCKI